MKNFSLSDVFFFALILVMIAISIPTVSLSLFGKKLNITGVNLSDVFSNTAYPNFTMQKGIDLASNKVAIVELLLNVDPALREVEMQRVRDIVGYRLEVYGILDYDVRALTNPDSAKLIIRVPDNVSDQVLTQLLKPGELSVWTISTQTQTEPQINPETGEVIVPTVEDKGIFTGRDQAIVSNADVLYTKVISDSRVSLTEAAFLNVNPQILSAETYIDPKNYGLEIGFTVNEFNSFTILGFLYSNLGGATPSVLAIDGQPVAVETLTNLTSTTPSMLFYTLGDDTLENTKITEALIASPAILHQIELQGITAHAPTSAKSFRYVVVMAYAVVFIGALFPFNKPQPMKFKFALVHIFALLTVFFGLIAGSDSLSISTPTASGVIAILILFIYYANKMSVDLEETVIEAEVTEIIDDYVKTFRDYAILLVALSITMHIYGVALLKSLSNGVGFAIIAAFMCLYVYAKPLAKLFIIKK